MNSPTSHGWRKDFGIWPTSSASFFESVSDLNASRIGASQGHVLRRAFDLLSLDGILCTDSKPLVYFKEVTRIDAVVARALHRTFWNHGGAPILVLISPDEVHVYSGLVKPAADGSDVPGLVDVIDRATVAIREFLPSVESGAFFRRNERFFDPDNRVDRELLGNLQATRDKLAAHSESKLESNELDALLCRVVFACYLFDREIVGESYLQSTGLRGAAHLRDVLGIQPREDAKRHLYNLFKQLGRDFNGDLFSDNLDDEADLIDSSMIGPLDDFFRATSVITGQGSFWPYDFAAIPVEAVSAIYERFLQGSAKTEGAFYTPRFLAELVLDMALADFPSLLGRRYLDPACGSGIFLVTLFNRMAEEWKQANPRARNDRRAGELREILCTSICGIDINPTACRITAFSLYLAYLDQLSPRDVLELGEKGHRLPRLVHNSAQQEGRPVEGQIWCGDFFDSRLQYPVTADLVVGNPPWGSTASKSTPAARWCAAPDRRLPVPDKQIAAAFIWKAAEHVSKRGRVCLIVPHSTLFNHTTTAIEFQRQLFTRYALDQVLNLADYRFFLFAEARHPALVISYRGESPRSAQHAIGYWSPKSNWLVMQTDIITVASEDRSTIKVEDVLRDLEGKDAPQIWKQRFWATPRDRRLIDRLSLCTRLRDYVRQPKDGDSGKDWIMAAGLQPVGENDDPQKAELVQLPAKLFVKTTAASKIDLFLLQSDCKELRQPEFLARNGSNKDTTVFKAPHVLVTKGFTRVAFADFPVSFQDFLRGIHGPVRDRNLLIFLAAYLRSPLARYFLFHTSSHWGITRPQVHIDEVLRLPFILPDLSPNPERAWEIVAQISRLVGDASTQSCDAFADRRDIVRTATEVIEPLIEEYFDVLPVEKLLLTDTVDVTIRSILPTRRKTAIPTIEPSRTEQREHYRQLLCDTLNEWSTNGPFTVQGRSFASETLGIGMAVLQKTSRGASMELDGDLSDLFVSLNRLRAVAKNNLNSVELIRGVKVFEGNRLYLVKQIDRRFWTDTAALNDADEIAGTILMHKPEGAA